MSEVRYVLKIRRPYGRNWKGVDSGYGKEGYDSLARYAKDLRASDPDYRRFREIKIEAAP